MTNLLTSLTSALVLLAGCSGTGCGAEQTAAPAPQTAPAALATPAAPAAPPYDVHEWGLVRGTAADTVMLSGPHATEPVAALAKPVLYFHRGGEGPLDVQVTVEMPRGRVVEHWPLVTDATEASLTWRGLSIDAGTCPGTRYPTDVDLPCSVLADACEAAELATVETTDSDCVHTADGAAWNHLFYRGELRGAVALPLRFEAAENGRVRVTNTGTSPIAGRLMRIRHEVNRTYAALVADPPGPGETIILDAPAGAVADAASALSTSLGEAGLTEAEAAAFRRAWDFTLFGAAYVDAAAAEHAEAGAGGGTASPGRVSWTTTLYVLPTSTADSLATLRFDPAPRSVRRVIVAWIDEARAEQPSATAR